MFDDLDPKRHYVGVIEKAAKYGLMMGTAQGVFEPDRPISRAEAAYLAVRLFEKTNEDFIEIVDLVVPSIVQVENDFGLGSGSIIRADGLVLTNCHVISRRPEGEELQIAETVGFRTTELPWSYAEGNVIAYDEHADLALCKIGLSTTFPAILFADPLMKHQAQRVMAVGSPLGLIQSVSEGTISGFRKLGDRPFIQTDAAINPGNSGGALVNLNGQMVGVPTQKYSSVGIEGLGFAIPIASILAFLAANDVAI